MTAAMLAGIVATSALGSVHCAAMCGPLVALGGGTRSPRYALAHAAGRLATYLALGAAGGFVGSAVDLAGRLGHVQRIALVIAGLAMVVWGAHAMATARGWVRARGRADGGAFGTAIVKLRSRSVARRAAAIGVLSGLLPCGWLWAFVITAAASAAPASGALVMLAFWLGTLPAMVGLVSLAGPMFGRVRAHMPMLTAIVLIVLGLGTLAVRWRAIDSSPVPNCCHRAET